MPKCHIPHCSRRSFAPPSSVAPRVPAGATAPRRLLSAAGLARVAFALFNIVMASAVGGCEGCDNFNVAQLRAEAVANDQVNFGDIYPGFVFFRTTSLTNAGLAPLRVDAVRFTEPAFSLAASAPDVLAPGESVELVVRAEPTAVGPLSSALEIQTDVGALTIRLVANVTEPPICSDDNPCTDDVLTPRDVGGAECVFTDREGTCDDGNACTVDTVCVLGTCVGLALDCDDGVACTSNLCQADIGCVFNPDDTQCADDDPCTDNVCTESGCAFPTATDYTPCGDVSCDIAELCIAGVCQDVPAFDGLPCDDGIEGSVGAVCEDGICLEGDVAPDVSVVWSNAEHTDLFYDVTSVSPLAGDRIVVTTRRQGERDAVHLLALDGDSIVFYQYPIPNLEGGARFHSIGNNRYARIDFDHIPGRTRVEVVAEEPLGTFTVESQTSFAFAVPFTAQAGVASWENGVAFCIGDPDANGTFSTPLDLMRIDLSEPGNPERLGAISNPTNDPCRGDQGFFFAQAEGPFMAVGSDAGGFLGEAVYFFRIDDTGIIRLGVAAGRWRSPTIGPGTFVFQRVDDDVWVHAQFDGVSFNTGDLTSPCLGDPGIRPMVVSNGASFWTTTSSAGASQSICYVQLPIVNSNNADEGQIWQVASNAFPQIPFGILKGLTIIHVMPAPDRNGVVGLLRTLSLDGQLVENVRNQGQIWDLQKGAANNVVLHANAQGIVLGEDELRTEHVRGFFRVPPVDGIEPKDIASVETFTDGGRIGSLRYLPPEAGHCDSTLVDTCFAPATFGVEFGRNRLTYAPFGTNAERVEGDIDVYTSATKFDRCVGIGQAASLGAVNEFAALDVLSVVTLCDPTATSIQSPAVFSPRPGEFFRLRDSFPHGDTHVSTDVLYVTPASATPYEAEMVLVDVQALDAPDIIATVPLGLTPFTTSAAYEDGVWAVVEQPSEDESQSVLTVVDVSRPQVLHSANLGVTSRKYPSRVLLVHEGFVFVNGVFDAGPEPFAEDTPFLRVYKLVNDTLFIATELDVTRNFTAMLPLNDGSILAADDSGWQTFVLEPNPPDPGED